MKTPLLSILTPTIPARREQLRALCAKIQRGIANSDAGGLVDHLVRDDEPGEAPLTIGAKRDRLIREARGKYVAFVDDDDDIAGDYVLELLRYLRTQPAPDVVTFEQIATINRETGRVVFGLGNPNEPFRPGGITLRNAWHVCAWRRDLAILSQFPSSGPLAMYGEDRAWAEPLWKLEGLRAVHIPIALHFYRHDAKTTAAPPPR